MNFKRSLLLILFSLFMCFVFAEDVDTEDAGADKKEEVVSDAKKDDAKKEKEIVDDEFASIQSSSLTTCHGDKWFLQEYDDLGKITLSVLYNKDDLLEKREYFYDDKYKTGLNISLKDKLIKIKYNRKGYEIERAVYSADGNTLIEKTAKEYDDNNLLLKKSVTKDDKEWVSAFTYNYAKVKQTQTDFIDDEKICFVEFKKSKKIIHLFQFGKEIKVLEEEY